MAWELSAVATSTAARGDCRTRVRRACSRAARSGVPGDGTERMNASWACRNWDRTQGLIFEQRRCNHLSHNYATMGSWEVHSDVVLVSAAGEDALWGVLSLACGGGWRVEVLFWGVSGANGVTAGGCLLSFAP
jgi:hypothetical protein